MNKLYIDINVIQSVPPSCINRDDTGSPKTAIYGGVKRARVSSQSWKKAMRDYFRESFDENELAYRSTKIISIISKAIIDKNPEKTEDEASDMAKEALKILGIRMKEMDTTALFFISKKQAENVAEVMLNGDADKSKLSDALKKHAGIELSLFGRMVADDPNLNVDASSQVAHSISTHRVENEFDFYTAIDDMRKDSEQGAGMMGVVEYNSSTLYRYATIAIHDLKKNLDEMNAVSKAVGAFVKAFLVSMPSGKQNTFANHTLPYAALITIRNDQPVNLVGAFESPVRPNKENGGYNEDSVKKMIEYKETVESSFVSNPKISWQIGTGLESVGPISSMEDCISQIEKYIMEQEF